MSSNNNNNGHEQHVDIEQYSKEGKKIPESGVIYFFKIDGHRHQVSSTKIFGKQLLDMAGHHGKHHEFDLYQKFSDGQRVKIEPDTEVDLSAFGVEKFITICKTNTDGLQNPKRDFALPEVDVEYLKAKKFLWETISLNNQKALIIYDYPVPSGYNVKIVTIALMIASGYPEAQIDMAYFTPDLKRNDGIGIRSAEHHNLAGQTWQRWSRHRTAANKWRPGVDDLSSHLAYVDQWLTAELKRGG
jgi:hypothetical protein